MKSFSQLLKRAFVTVFGDLKALLRMTFVSLLPMILWGVVGGAAYLLYILFDLNASEFPLAWEWILIFLAIVLLILFIVLSVVCTYLSYKAVYNRFIGKDESLRILFSQYRKTGKFFGTWVAIFIYLVWGLLLWSVSLALWIFHEYFFILGALVIMAAFIYISVAQSLTYAVFFFEGESWFTAVNRSYNIVKKHWWKTFWLYFLWTILVLILLIFVIASLALCEIFLSYFQIKISLSNSEIDWILQIIQIPFQSFMSFLVLAFSFGIYEKYKNSDFVIKKSEPKIWKLKTKNSKL